MTALEKLQKDIATTTAAILTDSGEFLKIRRELPTQKKIAFESGRLSLDQARAAAIQRATDRLQRGYKNACERLERLERLKKSQM